MKYRIVPVFCLGEMKYELQRKAFWGWTMVGHGTKEACRQLHEHLIHPVEYLP
jgi:hypothetical protein